ncbi:MAG: hypothetical protein A2351_03045 [Omnitrophica bacterium RIFOXYB12_FULL_50_7]|nr:MAG: hypothetical protein A2351_03045 [Omnitrophica bacterium RIFOXYB12_FULL_50_7]
MSGDFVELTRPQQLAKNIVVVDGMPHVGKQLVAQFISTIERGEISVVNSTIDNLCIASAFGKIQCDAAKAIINLSADMDLYNLMISRHTNFRKADDTGVFRNLVSARHQRRLSMTDGDPVVDRIRKACPILTYMTHHLFGISRPVLDAFGSRLKLFVVCVRHPLWVIDLWVRKKWHLRIGRELREFQMCCRVGNQNVPWFAGKWIPNYSKMMPVEQAVAVLQVFHDRYRDQMRRITPVEQKKVLFVPYELFTANPWPYLDQAAIRLKSRYTQLSHRMARSLSIPRPILTNLDIAVQQKKVEKMMRLENTPRVARRILDGLCHDYEQCLKNHNEKGTILR